MLLHVVDIAHPQFEDHIRTVNQTLKELEVENKPTLLLFNKIDLYRARYFDAFLDAGTKAEIEKELQQNLRNRFEHDNIFVSALGKDNIDTLRQRIVAMVAALYEKKYADYAEGQEPTFS